MSLIKVPFPICLVCGSTSTAWVSIVMTYLTSTSASAATRASSTSSVPCTSRSENANCSVRAPHWNQPTPSVLLPPHSSNCVFVIVEIDTSATESENETKTTIYMDTSSGKGKNKIWTTKYSSDAKSKAVGKNKRKSIDKKKPLGRKKSLSLPRVHKAAKTSESALERPQSIWSRWETSHSQFNVCLTD